MCIAVRLLMIALMLASLLMSIAIPEAFGDKGLLFAGAYVAIQVGRTAFLAFMAGERGSLERRRAENILVWFCTAGVFWIAGGLAEGDARIVLWLVALAIDYGGPLVTYWVPRVSGITHAFVDARHGALHRALRPVRDHRPGRDDRHHRRDHGRARGDRHDDDRGVLACVPGNGRSLVALFLVDPGTQRGGPLAATESVRVARDLYTYGHALLVAGIIVAAVGDELVIAHPEDELPTEELLPVVAGPALYLLAQAFFRFRITGQLSARRLGGVAALAVVWFAAGDLPALAVAALVVGVLVALCVADYIAMRAREPNVRIEDVWNLD